MGGERREGGREEGRERGREGGRERDLSFVCHLSKETHELRGSDELVDTGT